MRIQINRDIILCTRNANLLRPVAVQPILAKIIPKIMVLNARSIAKEDAFSAFHAELTDNNCNISLVCETWLKENFPTHLICPPGFTVLRNDREERRGGGVAIFCRCDWKIEILDEFANDFECMWARISTPNSVFYMCSIYHPPEPVYREEDLLEFLGDTCEQITSMDPNNIIVIGGDLNELKYKDLLTQASLAQLVKEPTRKNKILDVFITNKPYLWSKTKVIKSAVRTDHQMVLACPKDHVKAYRYTKAFRDVREHYKIKMFKLLEEYKWSSVLYSTQCIQEKVQNFQFALLQMYNDCFQVKTVLMSSRDPPFMSPLVKHLLKRRQALLRKGGQKQNPNVTILQERINKLIRENQLQTVKTRFEQA